MKILFVNQYYFPDVAATAQRLCDLAISCSERGHQVHVLCSRQSYYSKTDSLPQHNDEHEVTIHRIGGFAAGKKGTLARILHYLTFHLFGGLWILINGWRFDVIVSLTTPPLIGFGRTKHICWCMDLHPDCEFALGMWSRSNPIYYTVDCLSTLQLRSADAVVVLGAAMAQTIRDKQVEPDRVCEISIWGDEQKPIDEGRSGASFRSEHGLQQKFVVMYAGNAGLMHRFDAVCDAMDQLKNEPRIQFVFSGGGKRLDQIKRFVSENDLDNCLFVPYCPVETLGEVLAAADVHLVTLRDEASGLLLPSKTYSIMAAGRSILFVGPEDSDTARHICEANSGYVLGSTDGSALANTLISLANNPQTHRRLGENGRKFYADHFSQQMLCARWINLIETLVDSRNIAGRTECSATDQGTGSKELG